MCPDAVQSTETGPDPVYRPDPTFLHARREALLVTALWAACLLWAVPYCYFNGYAEGPLEPDQLATVWGIPSWAFYGIVVPWLLADVATAWFCFRFMKDDDLGTVNEGADIAEDLEPPRGTEVGE